MGISKSKVRNACYKYRILLTPESRKNAQKKAALKGLKTKTKKYNLVEWTNVKINKLKKLKDKGYSNKKISEILKVPKSSLCNACFNYRILLDEKTRKQKIKEAGIKGGNMFKEKRRNLIKLNRFDEDLGYIIGVCFGDGSIVKVGNSKAICLRTTNESFAKAFFNAVLDYTKVEPKYHIRIYDKYFKKENRFYKNVKYYEVFLYNIFFAEKLQNVFGSTIKWKIDVNKYLNYKKSFIIGFIRGLFDSEGSISGKKTSLGFSSTNKEGIESFYKLLSTLGFGFNFNVYKRKNGIIEYKIRSSKRSVIEKFSKEIGFNIDYKQKILKNFIKKIN